MGRKQMDQNRWVFKGVTPLTSNFSYPSPSKFLSFYRHCHPRSHFSINDQQDANDATQTRKKCYFHLMLLQKLGWNRVNLPIARKRRLLIHDNNANVMRSPRLAAIGVATLSGFILHFLENNITATIIEPVKLNDNQKHNILFNLKNSNTKSLFFLMKIMM